MKALQVNPLPWSQFGYCLALASLCHIGSVFPQTKSTSAEEDSEPVELQTAPTVPTVADEKELGTLRTEISTNENPDAVRRAKNQVLSDSGTGQDTRPWKFDFYGSVRLHAINHFDNEDQSSEFKIGDGASRVGVTGEWNYLSGWTLFGRIESGFDVLDTFTPRVGEQDGDLFVPRLHHLGIDSDFLYLSHGKSWSPYYIVAGAADRFSIFGGEAVGIYNAGTDGGATGTARADNATQTLIFIDFIPWVPLKPFNINLQYQDGEPIPKVKSEHYGATWSSSAWLEGDNELGVGVAYHHAKIRDQENLSLLGAGIDGDATATTIAVKSYGEKWLVSAVFSRHKNIETTDENKFINGRGSEVYAQWEYTNNWWLVAGGNWLFPDNDDPDAGKYKLSYVVLGLRYTFDDANRMIYAEWRNDHGTLSDGRSRGNEFTVGVRWDISY